MKSKYVLLTALSALVVGMGGANAADGLQVATKSYSDTHLASKDIAAPTTDEKNKVVTVNGDATGFVYTTAPSAGSGISKSTANAFSVNVDNSTIKVNANNKLEAQVMVGMTSDADGKAGLVPAPKRQTDDFVKFLRGDGTWAADRNTTYQAGAGLVQGGSGENLSLRVNVDDSTIKINGENKLVAQQMGAASSSAAGTTGLVPAPAAGKQTSFLRGDATWVEAYTKSEVDTKLAAKQASLSTAQLNAVNSGITSTKVSTYDGYATTIGNKLDKNTAITAADTNSVVKYDKNGLVVSGETAYTAAEVDTKLAGKQASLSTAQLSAVNSGITSTKVSTYDGYAATIATKAAAADLTAEVTRATGIEGTRVAGNYYAATDTLAQADKKIDTQVKTNATAIAALQSDTIRRPAQCTNGHKCALVQTVSADGLTVTEEWVDLTAVGGTSSAPTY